MQIYIAQNLDKDKWNEYISKHRHSTFFHTWEYRELLEDFFGFLPYYLIAENNQNEVCGVFPLIKRGLFASRLEGIPLSDFSGILADSAGIQEHLWDFAIKMFYKLGFKDFSVYSKTPFLGKNNFLKQDSHTFCSFRMSTSTTYGEIWKNLVPQKTRNMINKARKNNVETYIDYHFYFLKEYYSLYYQNMLRLNALPLPLSFFIALRNKCPENMHLFLSRKQGKIVAGILALEFNGVLNIWSNASNKWALRFAVNNAIYNEVIKYACLQNNIKFLDFGSTVKNTTLYDFKKKWGAEEYPIYRIGINEFQKSSYVKNLAMTFLNFLPKNLLSRISKLIYKYY